MKVLHYICVKLRQIDTPFLFLTLFLLAVGLLMLLSASFPSAYYETGDPYFYFKRQSCFAVIGCAIMFFLAFCNYEYLRRIAKPAMLLSIILLIAVLVPGIGVVRNNARRWISIAGFFTFQPSEIAKLAIIVFFSASIANKKSKMQTWHDGVKPYLLTLLLTSGLIVMEPHLSGAILILTIGVTLMFVGGIRLRWIVGAGIIAGAGVLLLLSGIIPYGQSRIAMWRDPFSDASGAGYQLTQSLITIGSGGLTGLGLGKSRQKFLFLPEEHNDFIFAIVCEELGLIGATLILLLFMLLILRGFWIALRAKDRVGTFLAVGVSIHIAIQTFLNVGVVTGLLPTTGVSLPFFSYGGTALLLQMTEIGIVLTVSATDINEETRVKHSHSKRKSKLPPLHHDNISASHNTHFREKI